MKIRKTMETTNYVSYDLALKLKACGFDEPCIAQWACEPDGKPILLGSTAFVFSNAELKGRDVTAPLLYHAQKWLREKHHISVRVSYISYHKVWFADWLNLDSGKFDDTDATFATYEEALADGISVALELIEQENK